jgi:serine/threonine-protein kinase
MGVVFAGTDLKTGKRVAIKVSSRNLSGELLQRFQLEATAMEITRHPHLCEVHSRGVSDDGLPFMVIERLPGETLRERLTRTGPFSGADTVAIGVQLLEALAAVHAAGVLHRDVKPANIIVTTAAGTAPFVKLIDFGLARLLRSVAGTENSRDITRVGAVPGTPAYLTPEQLRGARDLDEGVDVWGAGITMFELLQGHHPFRSSKREDLGRNIVLMPLPPFTSFRNDLPREFELVLEKALAKKRKNRWQTATEFRTALIEMWAHHRVAMLRRGADLVSGKEVSIDSEPTQVIVGLPPPVRTRI